MKRNMFGDPIAQPGDSYDDFGLPFMEMHGHDDPPEIMGARISEDPNYKWCAEMDTEEGDIIQAHEFESRDGLIDWLKDVVRLDESQIVDDEG